MRPFDRADRWHRESYKAWAGLGRQHCRDPPPRAEFGPTFSKHGGCALAPGTWSQAGRQAENAKRVGDETARTTTRVEGIKEMIYDAELRNALVACEAARGGAKSRPLTCLIQKGQQWQAALEFFGCVGTPRRRAV